MTQTATASKATLRAKKPSNRTLKNFLVKKKRPLFKAIARAHATSIFNTRIAIEREVGVHPKHLHGQMRNGYDDIEPRDRFEHFYTLAADRRRRKQVAA